MTFLLIIVKSLKFYVKSARAYLIVNLVSSLKSARMTAEN